MCPHARGLPAGPPRSCAQGQGPESHRDNPGGSAAYPRKRCIAGRPAVLPARRRAAQYRVPGVLPRQSRPKSGCSCTRPCCRRPAPDSAPGRRESPYSAGYRGFRRRGTAPQRGASDGAHHRSGAAQSRGLPGLCRLYQKNTPLFSNSPIRSPIISTLYGVMMKVLVATRLIWPLLA